MNRIALLAAVTAAGLALTGCSSSPSNTTSSTRTGHSSMAPSMTTPARSASAPAGPAASRRNNTADVTFATDMIPHHQQAIEMSTLAASRATNSTVKSLAAAIKSAQDPEVATMTGWLKRWGRPMPSSMSGMDMAGGTAMMSPADMAKLGKATGAAFDRMWVKMMIAHHQGAVTAARTELARGANADAKQLAQSIVTSQTAQILQLKALLTTLPS